MSAHDELDPTEFVARIRQLGEQRDQQDAERVRKLEEDIIQGRSERLARRAERARSLSPEKSNTPQSQRSTHGTPRSVLENAAESPILTPTMDTSSAKESREDSLARLTGSPDAPFNDEPKKRTPSVGVPTRSGTLSWQQRRPQSAARRPLSMAGAEKTASQSPRETPEPTSPEDSGINRIQIAQSLRSKDPSFFRQTADRGIGSAAYRKSQEDTPSEVGSISGRRQLPGLSRESTAEPEASSPPPESLRSSSPSRGSSVRGSAAWSNRFSTNTSLSGGDGEYMGKRSPLPMLDSQKFSLPPSEQTSARDSGEQSGLGRAVAMSPAQGRISPERMDRPASPTKGLGGFVQSAMLKRTDSQSKRFSAQGPPALSRHGSTASNRGTSASVGGMGVNASKFDPRPSSLSRDNSMEPSSRPTSSSSNLTITKGLGDLDTTFKDHTFAKPALPNHSRGKSVASTFDDGRKTPEEAPPSPSKRWSPTKSSWLESALNKPDSPKPKAPPPAQPAWMAEINRIKQQRSSVDLGGNADLKGLSVLSPSHSPTREPASPTKLSSRVYGRSQGSSSATKEPALAFKFPQQEPAPFQEPIGAMPPPLKVKPTTTPTPEPKPEVEEKKEVEKSEPKAVEKPKPTTVLEENRPQPPPATKPLSIASRFPSTSTTPASLSEPKPNTPPKKDFRTTLKPRQGTSDGQKEEVPEFLRAVGKLKRAQADKYVAPDELKNNILRGKAGLQFTGGPKPSQRKDELKESLIKQKEAIKTKASETGLADKAKLSSSAPTPTTPEALAKRKNLGRSDSTTNPPPIKEKPISTTPEAIARQKSLREKPKPVSFSKDPQLAPDSQAKEPVKQSKLSDRFNPALAGLLARGPSALAGNSGAAKPSSSSESLQTPRSAAKEAEGPGPELTHKTKGRAKGPKRRAPTAKKEEASSPKVVRPSSPKAVQPSSPKIAKPSSPKPVQTSTPKHGRIASVSLVKNENILRSNAAPLSSLTTSESQAPAETSTPWRSSLKPKPLAPTKSPQHDRQMEKLPSPEIPRKPKSPELERRFSATFGGKPLEPTSDRDSLSSRLSSASTVAPLKLPARPLPTPPVKPVEKPTENLVEKPVEEPIKPPFETPKAASRFSQKSLPKPEASRETSSSGDAPEHETSRFSVKGATALWGRQSQSSSPEQTRSKSPIKLPTKADERAAMEEAGLARAEEQPQPLQQSRAAPKPKPVGLGLGFTSAISSRPQRESSPPKSFASSYPASPPLSGGRPISEPPRKSPPAESNNPFAEYFDEPPVTAGELPSNIDAQQMLTSSPLDLGPSGKITKSKMTMKEIYGSGLVTTIPVQEQHILFQESMYIITHYFEDSQSAKHTEVYLWAGNDVADATLDDAHLFARAEAKQANGKLLILRQGKETPNFFEALGGIVITRRGARPGAPTYMLCGRRHLGHIAFDEVDRALKSLCSGFPYLLASPSGAIFLWRGAGCSEEEVSGARLVGMAMGSSGELLEILEGSENPAFFASFPLPEDTSATARGKQPAAAAVPRSADHWRYKKTHDKYRARLFRVEQHATSQNLGVWGAGAGLQVSSFFTKLRRPSWGAVSPTTSRPQTPGTPKSPMQLPQLPAGGTGWSTKVVEVAPFAQRDLEPEGVCVLDAFFEVYIIVGPLSHAQSHAFATALLFAQEYGILAASAEDRPFVPVTTVVLEGVPKDMKAVFRHWDDARIPAAGLMKGKLGRGKSLRIVGLERALEGTRG